MYRPQRTLLQALLSFVNDGEMKIPNGPVYDSQLVPIAVFRIPTGYESAWKAAHGWALGLLTRHCREGEDVSIAHVNKTQLRTIIWTETQGTPYVAIPIIEHPIQFPAMALYLAFTTPTGAGDSWAHRIRKCDFCAQFFIQKTRKQSRFCRDKCRWDFFNSRG